MWILDRIVNSILAAFKIEINAWLGCASQNCLLLILTQVKFHLYLGQGELVTLTSNRLIECTLKHRPCSFAGLKVSSNQLIMY